MRAPTRFTQRIALVAVLALVLALAGTGASAANDEVRNTCKDHPAYDQNREGNTSGDWGSIAFTPDAGPLVLKVNEGHEVWLCLKKGSASSGMGVVEVGPFEGPLEGVEVDYPGSVPAEGFSHYGVRYSVVTTTTTEDTTTTTEPEVTTTTTEPEVTTTTTEADEGVEGIEVEATTTTAAAEVEAEVVTALPRTGVGSAATALVAVAGLLGGAGLLAGSRRRQLIT